MYSDNKKGKAAIDTTTQQNRIAQDTTIVGDIRSKGGFRIDGTVEGSLKTPGKIVVGKTGVINGTIEGANADFEGRFSGKLKLSGTLTLKTSAYLEGEVEVDKLAVEPGATFNATCAMKGAVKELNNGGSKKPQGTGKSA